MTALRRLALAALAAWLAYALAWTLSEAAPRPAAERAARAAGVLPPDDDAAAPVRAALIARAEERFDLGGGAAARVTRAAGRALAGDLGASWRDGAPVADRVGPAALATLRLIAPALLLALVAGVALGAAGRGARALGAATALALGLPPVWLAQLALGAGAGGALMAAVVLAIAPAAVVAAHGGAALAGFLASPVAVAARARGAAERRVAWRHGLRLALPSLAPLAASAGAYLVGASAVVERAFALPGLGRVALDAAATGDVPVLAAVTAIAALVIAVLAGAADLAARAADPRLRGQP